MNLRMKSLMIIGISLICMVGIIYAISRFTFMKGIENIELVDASTHVEQTSESLSYIISNLEIITADWASWDDTYTFIKDGNQEYIESNIVSGTFITLKINLMLFTNSSGDIVFSKAVSAFLRLVTCRR